MTHQFTRFSIAGAIAVSATCGGFSHPGSLATARAADIDKCDPHGTKNLTAAAKFVDQHLEDLTATFTHLTSKQRDEFKRKWPKVKVVCKDDGHNTCTRKSEVLGYAHGGFGNKIRACYYNMVDANAALCDAVGILVHEMGHANGYPSMKGHNDPTPAIYAQDTMYKMGAQASRYCLASGVTNTRLTGTAQRNVGESCSLNDQCESGKCSNDNVCMCTKDDHCDPGEQCYEPLGKPNFCAGTAQPLGASCNRDSQCSSDKCEKDECVCKTDDDCTAYPAKKCKTPITGKNHCE